MTKNVIQNFFFAILIWFFTLLFLDSENVRVLNLKQFFFPQSAEIVGLENSGTTSLPFLDTILFNGRILVESLITGGGAFHSKYPSYTLADYRFPLVGFAIFPLVIAGLIISISRIARRSLLFSMPYLTGIILLLITTFPQLLSSVYISNDPGFPSEARLGTLSNHRLFYALFACYFMVSVTFFWLIEKVGENIGRKISVLLFFSAVYAYSASTLLIENTRFQTKLADIDPSLSSERAQSQWSDGGANTDRSGPSHSSHLQQHAQYYRLARKIASITSIHNPERNLVLVYVPSRILSESLLAPATLPYIKGLNFHSVFLTLYLEGFGVGASWILMLDKSRTSRQLGFSWSGEYSAQVTRNAEGDVSYRSPDNLLGFIRFNGALATTSVIVATTIEELLFAQKWLAMNSVQYKVATVESYF